MECVSVPRGLACAYDGASPGEILHCTFIGEELDHSRASYQQGSVACRYAVIHCSSSECYLCLQLNLTSHAASSLVFHPLMKGICYMSDRAYSRTGALPAWYMTLRGYLTSIAGLSMLATTAYFLFKDIERAMLRMEEDDRRKASQIAGKDAANAAAVAVSSNVGGNAPSLKKGWW